MSEPDAIGRRLDVARERLGWSIAELARRAAMAPSTLSAIHTGARRGDGLSLAQTMRLAQALHISVDWLCGFLSDDVLSLAPPDPDAPWRLPGPEEWPRIYQGALHVMLCRQNGVVLVPCSVAESVPEMQGAPPVPG